MADRSFPLKIVDAKGLDEELREILRPGGRLRDGSGKSRRLPRYFYEIGSWDVALNTTLTPHFMVWEFINVDVREAERLRIGWPRYIPCAVTLLAAHLELLRQEVDTFVHIAANGGYRSPSHALSTHASLHCWGTAVNIHRIGDDDMDDEKTIRRYAATVAKLFPTLWTRPYGSRPGQADDHLHLDLGYVTVLPRDSSAEERDEEDPLPEDEEVSAVAKVGA